MRRSKLNTYQGESSRYLACTAHDGLVSPDTMISADTRISADRPVSIDRLVSIDSLEFQDSSASQDEGLCYSKIYRSNQLQSASSEQIYYLDEELDLSQIPQPKIKVTKPTPSEPNTNLKEVSGINTLIVSGRLWSAEPTANYSANNPGNNSKTLKLVDQDISYQNSSEGLKDSYNQPTIQSRNKKSLRVGSCFGIPEIDEIFKDYFPNRIVRSQECQQSKDSGSDASNISNKEPLGFPLGTIHTWHPLLLTPPDPLKAPCSLIQSEPRAISGISNSAILNGASSNSARSKRAYNKKDNVQTDSTIRAPLGLTASYGVTVPLGLTVPHGLTIVSILARRSIELRLNHKNKIKSDLACSKSDLELNRKLIGKQPISMQQIGEKYRSRHAQNELDEDLCIFWIGELCWPSPYAFVLPTGIDESFFSTSSDKLSIYSNLIRDLSTSNNSDSIRSENTNIKMRLSGELLIKKSVFLNPNEGKETIACIESCLTSTSGNIIIAYISEKTAKQLVFATARRISIAARENNTLGFFICQQPIQKLSFSFNSSWGVKSIISPGGIQSWQLSLHKIKGALPEIREWRIKMDTSLSLIKSTDMDVSTYSSQNILASTR